MFISNKFLILPEIKLKQEVFSADNIIGFIHTPKTGGYNVNYLTKALLAKQKLNHFTICYPCNNHTNVLIISEGFFSGVQKIKNNPDFFDLSNKSTIAYINGHTPLPSYDYFKISMDYITIVRDPLDRLLSLGNYLYQVGYLKENAVKDVLLNEVVDNLQTRWIAGEIYMNGPCTDETYAKALKNIQEIFKIVAPTEDVNIVLSLIASHLGFYDVAFTKINITKYKIVTKEDTELCQKILERNQYDQKLYEYVKVHWESWKDKYIESITDNIAEDKQYLMLSPLLYNRVAHKMDDVSYMTVEKINMFGLVSPEATEELISYKV